MWLETGRSSRAMTGLVCGKRAQYARRGLNFPKSFHPRHEAPVLGCSAVLRDTENKVAYLTSSNCVEDFWRVQVMQTISNLRRMSWKAITYKFWKWFHILIFEKNVEARRWRKQVDFQDCRVKWCKVVTPRLLTKPDGPLNKLSVSFQCLFLGFR